MQLDVPNQSLLDAYRAYLGGSKGSEQALAATLGPFSEVGVRRTGDFQHCVGVCTHCGAP